MTNVFVYGTLRMGGRNDSFLEGAECIYSQCRVRGKLLNTDKDYPVMQPDNSSWVFGELYSVTDSQMKTIDVLEGYEDGRSDNLYHKITTPVWNESGEECRAVVFTAARSINYSTHSISSGDWCVNKYIKRDKLLYFAYGSCLDDERFRSAGADHFFKHVFGSGVLNGFEFRFSVKTNDGGKADIVENKAEDVEGKVYEIPAEALEYLYRREGVYNRIYRPAIVLVSIAGVLYQALTFIGIKKTVETAPTSLYATEIMRGGNDCFSNHYKEKLTRKLDRFHEG
ncbi:gamma-glutamylcyclotransferase [Virgibacillus ihumii]|uniref:gamma-glutamylcyclotransferase n=1 Tax=Virgibacillus ihumii TaxID=2686091 RepID=UPI00157CA21A|nr:gamma-glutamylcyclotransferase family protein [Virgibacillus ihumii]